MSKARHPTRRAPRRIPVPVTNRFGAVVRKARPHPASNPPTISTRRTRFPTNFTLRGIARGRTAGYDVRPGAPEASLDEAVRLQICRRHLLRILALESDLGVERLQRRRVQRPE